LNDKEYQCIPIRRGEASAINLLQALAGRRGNYFLK
jgi:hypothetical protein